MLSVKQAKAVSLLFDGKSQKYIAIKLKVHENTVGNWKKLPEFKNELQKKSDDYLAEIRAKMIKNQENLALKAKSEMVRFSATKDLLDRSDIVSDKSINENEEYENDGLLEAINNRDDGLWDDE